MLSTNDIKMIDTMIRATKIFLTDLLPRADPNMIKNSLAYSLVTKEGVVLCEETEEVASDSVVRAAKEELLVDLLSLMANRAIRDGEDFVTERRFLEIIITDPKIKIKSIIVSSKAVHY